MGQDCRHCSGCGSQHEPDVEDTVVEGSEADVETDGAEEEAPAKDEAEDSSKAE